MHDIDRTQLEAEEFGLEMENFEFDIAPERGMEMEAESVLSETDEMELASELLEVGSDGELDQFLGKLIKKVGGIVGKVAKSPVGKALGGYLKPLIKKALPMAGGALGGMFGGPLGAQLGSQLATGAGGAFGLELEGLSGEDREMELAKRAVRMAGAAAGQALQNAAAGVNPLQAAQQAVVSAARQIAPGVLGGGAASAPSVVGQSGRWIRRGRRIILLDVF